MATETLPQVGTLTLEAYSSKRRRYSNTRTNVTFRCDAAAWVDRTAYLLSVTGPESSVKALHAALHSEGEVGLSVKCGDNSHWNLSLHEGGYRVRRHKILPAYGLWQVLVMAKEPAFMPALSEESVWQYLKTDKFTTPILREWLPWLMGKMRAERLLQRADGFGCASGLLFVTDEKLESLVTEGVKGGHLTIRGLSTHDRRLLTDGFVSGSDLDSYLSAYGSILASQAERSLEPLHVPTCDPICLPPLLRKPFDGQGHVATALAKTLRRQDTAWLIGEMGVGKAQPLDAKVLTPSGWKNMGDMSVGDKVIDPNGGMTTVVGVFPQGSKDVYRVTFTDGASTECCEDHLWQVSKPIDKWRGRQPRVLTLRELLTQGVYLKDGKCDRKNLQWYIPLTKPVEFPSATGLPLDPYLMGLLLGDGSFAHPDNVSFSTADEDLRSSVASLLPSGVLLRKKKDARNDYNYVITTGRLRPSGGNPVTNIARQLTLMGHKSNGKFIPVAYLYGSIEQRLAILQGLLDTDGSTDGRPGHLEYGSVSEQLAKDVLFLVRSLGGTSSWKVKKTTYVHKGERRTGLPYYRLIIRLPNGIMPFRLPRKRDAYKPTVKYHPCRGIVSIELVGQKECQCIAVNSPGRLYVTNDFVVTHNSLVAAAAIHAHAAGKPYRALVFCPGQLTEEKWPKGEIGGTIPDARATVIRSWRDLLKLDKSKPPQGPEWFVIARDRAKLGSCWGTAVARRAKMKESYLLCAGCGRPVLDAKEGSLTISALTKKRLWCERVLAPVREMRTGEDGKVREHTVWLPADGCGAPLWQMNRELDRYAPALYIKRKLKDFFTYLIVDEAHQENAPASAQANAAGALISACEKSLLLTGTLSGGYAWHLKHLLFRSSPASLVAEGHTWGGDTAFNECYGRIETTVKETKKEGTGGADNRMSHGSTSRTQTKRVVPGISPKLFARHLVDKAVFLSLEEVAADLPPVSDDLIGVEMAPEQKAEYKRVEGALRQRLKEMLIKGDRRLLGRFLQTLLTYPDHPWAWADVGYEDRETGAFTSVVTPGDLGEDFVGPKEVALTDFCLNERLAGRQTWVYVQNTGEHDVLGRLEKALKAAGLKAKCLRASVGLEKREAWIRKNAPGIDVMVSHPKLVETGLDLFDKGGSYNFPSLAFYQTGYFLFTVRQAARRSWRIGQTADCKVAYFYYKDTMQERAMALMGKKQVAAAALEGKFSSEGLAAMCGDDGSLEVALARSLVERAGEGDARRAWAKFSSVGGKA